MASKAFLRALRKKHHLGEFRRSKSIIRKSHSIKHTRRLKMAKKHRSSKRSAGMGGIMANAVGVGGYILWEAVVQPKIPLAATTLNIAELAAGIYLSKKGGVIGNVAKTAVVLNLYQLIKPLVSNAMGSTSTTSFFN